MLESEQTPFNLMVHSQFLLHIVQSDLSGGLADSQKNQLDLTFVTDRICCPLACRLSTTFWVNFFCYKSRTANSVDFELLTLFTPCVNKLQNYLGIGILITGLEIRRLY